MIQANELRIGNKLYFGEIEKIVLTVETISKTGINGVEERDEDMDSEGVDYTPGFYEYKFDELKPIPLTPEWIAKCGIKVEKWEGQERFSNKPASGVSWVHENIEGDIRNHVYVEIKHLHQLQNIYFALIGKELIINLEL